MRNLAKFLIVLMGCVALNACSKSSGNNISPAAAAAGYMKATIGDSAFSVQGSNGGIGAYAGLVTSGGVNTITIYGVTSWNKTIQIVLYNDTGKGTFSLPSLLASAYYYPNGLSGSTYTYAQTGKIFITQYSPTLVGSFNFVCTDNTHIGNGTFSVPLP